MFLKIASRAAARKPASMRGRPAEQTDQVVVVERLEIGRLPGKGRISPGTGLERAKLDDRTVNLGIEIPARPAVRDDRGLPCPAVWRLETSCHPLAPWWRVSIYRHH